MLRFQHPEYLYALALVIVIALAFLWLVAWRRRAIKKLGDPALVRELFIGYSRRVFNARFWLLVVAFIFLAVGCANLQMGSKMEKITRKGVDVVIALDVSKSMLAEDVQPSRLDRAKQLVNRLLDKMTNDRVGLVVFAGGAYLQMPLTVDYSAARMYLGSVNPGMLPSQGTALDKAIEKSAEAFSKKERGHKAIIIISDGEGWDDDAVAAAEKAHDEGIVINTVGVGTVQGGPFRDPQTNNYKKDEKGDIVITKMDDKLLRGVASAGHGIYAHLESTDAVTSEVLSQLSTMEKKEFGESLFTDYNSYFQYFLAVGLVSLLLEFIIPGKTRRKAPAAA